MSLSPERPVRDIRTILRKHLGQRTVLGVAIPILADQVRTAKMGKPATGLTEKEIESGFKQLAGKYIKSEYHSTYIDRRLGRRGFLELVGDRYKIREGLVAGLSPEQLEDLHNELVDSLRSAFEQRQTVIKRLEEVCSLPKECVSERYALVDAYLSQLTGNRGEMFEVVSFAVLREYFRTFGFLLQRFSTTHANDGGMDFVGGEAIYQVTTDESMQKVRRDLQKSPGTKRVLVRPRVTEEITELSEADVLEAIDLKDLLNHFVAWLLSRDTRTKEAKHVQQVIQVALEEFRRENRAETA